MRVRLCDFSRNGILALMVILLLLETSIQLVPDGSILLHIVLILIMVAVLNRTLFGPINRILAEREKKGSGALAEASDLESRVKLGNKRYSDALRAARASGYKLMEERRSEDLLERQNRLEGLKADIEAKLVRERAAIHSESRKARDEFDSLPLGTRIRDQILTPLEDAGRVD